MFGDAYEYIKLEVITSSNKIGDNKTPILISTYSANSFRHCTFKQGRSDPTLKSGDSSCLFP